MNNPHSQRILKCPLCNNHIEENSGMCEYCGAVISYEDEKKRLYVTSKICSKCGSENEPDASRCGNCSSVFTAICPRCKGESPLVDRYCKQCGLRIDQFHIEEKGKQQQQVRKAVRYQKIGRYCAGVPILLVALFCLDQGLDSGSGDLLKTCAAVFFALVFLALCAVIVKPAFDLRRGKKEDSAQ